MQRKIRTVLASLVTVLLVAACGSATPGGSSSVSSKAAFVNPTGGPLRTYTTIEELTKVLSPECRWTIKHKDSSTPDSAWCEPESLAVALSHDSSVLTVEKLQTALAQPNYGCEWWGMLVFSYSLTRTSGSDLYSAAGVTPSDLPDVTTSVERPAGSVHGGNWWTTYGTTEQGQRLTMDSGGYLVAAPVGCPGESASPTPSTTRSDERTVCSSDANAFLATLVSEGLPGVNVETVPERGPRPMDAATCMADYVADTDRATVEKLLTAYLRSLGYVVTRHISSVVIVVATAQDKPRVELQLPDWGEGTSPTAPFEVLIADRRAA